MSGWILEVYLGVGFGVKEMLDTPGADEGLDLEFSFAFGDMGSGVERGGGVVGFWLMADFAEV
jgi:hypothetical protein